MRSVYDTRLFVTGHKNQVERDPQLLAQFSAPYLNRFVVIPCMYAMELTGYTFVHGKRFKHKDIEKNYLKGSRSETMTSMPIV